MYKNQGILSTTRVPPLLKRAISLFAALIIAAAALTAGPSGQSFAASKVKVQEVPSGNPLLGWTSSYCDLYVTENAPIYADLGRKNKLDTVKRGGRLAAHFKGRANPGGEIWYYISYDLDKDGNSEYDGNTYPDEPRNGYIHSSHVVAAEEQGRWGGPYMAIVKKDKAAARYGPTSEFNVKKTYPISTTLNVVEKIKNIDSGNWWFELEDGSFMYDDNLVIFDMGKFSGDGTLLKWLSDVSAGIKSNWDKAWSIKSEYDKVEKVVKLADSGDVVGFVWKQAQSAAKDQLKTMSKDTGSQTLDAIVTQTFDVVSLAEGGPLTRVNKGIALTDRGLQAMFELYKLAAQGNLDWAMKGFDAYYAVGGYEGVVIAKGLSDGMFGVDYSVYRKGYWTDIQRNYDDFRKQAAKSLKTAPKGVLDKAADFAKRSDQSYKQAVNILNGLGEILERTSGKSMEKVYKSAYEQGRKGAAKPEFKAILKKYGIEPAGAVKPAATPKPSTSATPKPSVPPAKTPVPTPTPKRTPEPVRPLPEQTPVPAPQVVITPMPVITAPPTPVSGVEGASEWILESALPAGATVVNRKWTYTQVSTSESAQPQMDGWSQTGSYWKQAGTGSVEYAQFPSGYNTGDATYSKYNAVPYTASDDGARRRTVTDTRTGYIYYHYADSSTNLLDITAWNRWIENHPTGKYKRFYAFTDTQDYGHSDGRGNTDNSVYYCDKGKGTVSYWWYRIDLLTSTYADEELTYTYAKTETLESGSPVTPSESVSDVQAWVQYSAY